MTNLFEQMTIGTMTARNRVVRAATAESLAAPSGRPTRRLLDMYKELACGGVGTIITGYTFVTPDGRPSEGALALCDDAFLGDYRELAELAHEGGARIVMQLVYGGSKSKLAPDDPRWLVPVGTPSKDRVPNARILGASALENPRTHIVPTEATPHQLAALAQAFGAAAARAQASGFDGVEVHAAHGYLLSQFLSRRFNVRQDEYGGTLQNRARLTLECVAAVRAAVGPGYPVLVKVNSCDDLEDPAGACGGLSQDECAQVAAWLVQAGANCLDVSGDWHAVSSRDVAGEPFFADFGARLARELDVPIIVTGGWRRLDVIQRHLQADGIAGIAMSRPLICEPNLVSRWQQGNAEPSKCTACGHCQKHVGIPCALRQ